MRPRSLLILRNPHARHAPSEGALEAAARPLREHGWAVRLESTRTAGEAITLATEAAEAGIDVVAACGGDGTVHEVVQALAGTRTALAVVPAGTANVWAREAGVPLDVARSISLIPSARAVRVDVGMVEGDFGQRRFLLMCGVGLDAGVVRRVEGHSRGKRILGKGWYGIVATRVLARARGVDCEVAMDGVATRRPLLQLVAGNTRLYGGVMRLTSLARMDDGLLDVCLFEGGGRRSLMRLLFAAARGDLAVRRSRGVDYLRGERVTVTGTRPLPIQADGEYVGETPATISVTPGDLTVLMGTRRNPLLGEDSGDGGERRG
ncbi:MAG: diacylglycerol kinase family protein [Dehalococcoidia bacterium]